ncbi:MAG: hypothetical protein IH897_08235 [Planctomycetes bacterium]|nr:hypothetical protein [Planctomycetota bacterium]
MTNDVHMPHRGSPAASVAFCFDEDAKVKPFSAEASVFGGANPGHLYLTGHCGGR